MRWIYVGTFFSYCFQDENSNAVVSRVRLVKSSMTRATETGNIIHSRLPQVPIESCDLIQEGAPCEPDPPIGRWISFRLRYIIPIS